MFDLMVGQDLQFCIEVRIDDIVIPKGTVMRVEAILPRPVGEPKLRVSSLEGPRVVLTVPRHILAMHCRVLGMTSSGLSSR